VTIKPNGTVAVLPLPRAEDLATFISADYWRAPVPLVTDAQVSLIPVQFHQAIVALGKLYFAEKLHDTGLYSSAGMEVDSMLKEMHAHCLPGNEEDNKSESTVEMHIEVE